MRRRDGRPWDSSCLTRHARHFAGAAYHSLVACPLHGACCRCFTALSLSCSRHPVRNHGIKLTCMWIQKAFLNRSGASGGPRGHPTTWTVSHDGREPAHLLSKLCHTFVFSLIFCEWASVGLQCSSWIAQAPPSLGNTAHYAAPADPDPLPRCN